MISFCTTVKNRSRVDVEGRELLLFPNCVRSIRDAVPHNLAIELVVVDWASDDWPLEEWLSTAAAPVPVTLLEVNGAFSRGRGLNLAAQAAKGDLLFFLDTDVLISRELIEACVMHGGANHAYFPILYTYDDAAHLTGHWVDYGYGHCALKRKIFEQTTGWPEYKTWGREDNDFYEDLSSRVSVVRECVPGFFHQWHPADLLWKNRYSEMHPFMVEEVQQRTEAIRDLCSLIAEGSQIVLVDEARFGSDPIPNRKVYPFLERNGEYFGPPSDDDTAIREVERMREKGVGYIAFAWMAFWWLEYYSQFYSHLRSNFQAILDDNRLLLFDLNKAPDDESIALASQFHSSQRAAICQSHSK